MTTTALTTTTPGSTPVSSAEWRGMLAQAETLAQTQIVPKPFRGKAHDIVAVALIGRELGLSPMMSMQYIHVIDGKPAMSAELMNARVRMAGHRITLKTLTAAECTLEGERRDTHETQQATYTIEDAKLAGLLKDGGNWVKVPKAMLWARCVSMLCRQLFPDVIAGASYVPEELGAVVDEDGVPVQSDAPTTALPADLPADLAAHVATPPASDTLEEEDITDVEPIDDDADEFPTLAPPAPPTAEEKHRAECDDLFRNGWPFGSAKGADPMDPTAVDDGAIRYMADRADVTHPQYGKRNRRQLDWCNAELARRATAEAIGDSGEPLTLDQQAELFDGLVDTGMSENDAREKVDAMTITAQSKPGVFAKAMERINALHMAQQFNNDETEGIAS